MRSEFNRDMASFRRREIYCTPVSGCEGFSLLESLVAITIFSIALLALSSISLSVVGGNVSSSRYIEASLLVQKTIEDLRSIDFNLGADMAIGGGDDTIGAGLGNCSIANDAETDPATLFADPDYSYTVDANGFEVFPLAILQCPSGLAVASEMRRTWSIRDDDPVAGMKTVYVVVGWSEKGSPRYVSIATAIVGE
ncbi:MAG: prepilin-type N-terminal cleavage/methylation domain-containing protein [Nitrospinota bacterium]|nr:prepilin-type N-terminal cleavage/methylation domain-containing protein [Nitrospinota bacterium]